MKIRENKVLKTKSKVKTKIVTPSLVKPVPLSKTIEFSYVGSEDLDKLLYDRSQEVHPLVKKFQNRFSVKLKYVDRFSAFKILKKEKHVDWITLNELMKRYDCRVPPVSMNLNPQRPYKESRIY